MSEESVSSYQAAGEEDRQFKVIRLLADYPVMSQRDSATHVGISLGPLNYCLKALIDKGFVKLENFQNSKHKFKYGYILTPSRIAHKVAITGRFLKRKMREYEALKVEIEGLESELGTAVGKLRRVPCKWDSDSSRYSLWRLRHRLWTLSPTGFRKQFLCLMGDESLVQQATRRLMDLDCHFEGLPSPWQSPHP